MSKGPKGFGPGVSIEPSTYRKGSFIWGLIEIPFVLFVSILAGTGVGFLMYMGKIYSMDELPRIFMRVFEYQSALMIAIPITLTTLYIIVKNLQKP